ncbi:MAG: lipopolysaccharide kinase InaA family protein [Flavobacteriaceae bacterium]
MGNPKRNQIKKVSYKSLTINVKAFKLPHLLNQVIYGYIRQSKASRSFKYANTLLENNIGTPKPIAYIECKNLLGLRKSYYISENLEYDLTYRELVTDPHYPSHEAILRAFTRFTYDLHEKGVNFLDHSPGNTLIVKRKVGYDFYLVDLNRMKFQEMSFHDRMQNFSRLTPKKEMVVVMSDEYAKISGLDYDRVYSKMWQLTEEFQEKFHRKQRLKKQIKFWKK